MKHTLHMAALLLLLGCAGNAPVQQNDPPPGPPASQLTPLVKAELDRVRARMDPGEIQDMLTRMIQAEWGGKAMPELAHLRRWDEVPGSPRLRKVERITDVPGCEKIKGWQTRPKRFVKVREGLVSRWKLDEDVEEYNAQVGALAAAIAKLVSSVNQAIEVHNRDMTERITTHNAEVEERMAEHRAQLKAGRRPRVVFHTEAESTGGPGLPKYLKPFARLAEELELHTYLRNTGECDAYMVRLRAQILGQPGAEVAQTVGRITSGATEEAVLLLPRPRGKDPLALRLTARVLDDELSNGEQSREQFAKKIKVYCDTDPPVIRLHDD